MEMEPRTIRHRFPDAGSILAALGFVLLVNLVGALPSVFFSPDTPWFRSLERPWFYPPSIAFPVVWTLLFTLMGVALWLVWRSDADGRRLALGLFVVQMALNVAWTPAFFGLEAPLVALGIILALWLFVVGTVTAFRRVDARAAALLLPYLAWVTFATVLNFELWRLNA